MTDQPKRGRGRPRNEDSKRAKGEPTRDPAKTRIVVEVLPDVLYRLARFVVGLPYKTSVTAVIVRAIEDHVKAGGVAPLRTTDDLRRAHEFAQLWKDDKDAALAMLKAEMDQQPPQ